MVNENKKYQKPKLKVHGDLKKVTGKSRRGGDSEYSRPS
jgi:hypothetical protein